jgi:hypothetical protein
MASNNERIVTDYGFDLRPQFIETVIEACVQAPQPRNLHHEGFNVEQPLINIFGPSTRHEPYTGNLFQSNKIAIGFEDAVPKDRLDKIVLVDTDRERRSGPFDVYVG